VVSFTPRPLFTPGENPPGTYWIGGWVGPRAGLDAGARRKILCPCRGSIPDHPARSHTLYCLSYRGSRCTKNNSSQYCTRRTPDVLVTAFKTTRRHSPDDTNQHHHSSDGLGWVRMELMEGCVMTVMKLLNSIQMEFIELVTIN
jgi:hypothetical protein